MQFPLRPTLVLYVLLNYNTVHKFKILPLTNDYFPLVDSLLNVYLCFVITSENFALVLYMYK